MQLAVQLMLTFCCFFTHLVGNSTDVHANQGKGTLIVTYHTGRNGERLDRVRFRLINEQKEQTLYPRTGSFSDTSGTQIRRVTIPNLPVGHYTIEFVLPNYDDLFGEIPSREITITNGEIAKIDQGLKPRYARVKATAVIPEGKTLGAPTIRLKDSQGKLEAESQEGELSTNNLLPGHYTLFFDRYGDYAPPDPIHFDVVPGAIIGPFERHYTDNRPEVPPQEPTTQPIEEQPKSDSVAESDNNSSVPDAPLEQKETTDMQQESTNTPPAQEPPLATATLEFIWPALSAGRVHVILRPIKGEADVQHTFRLVGKQAHDTLKDLPAGDYELTYELPSNYFPLNPQQITLASGQVTTLSPAIQEARVIRVSSNIATAEYTLTNDATSESWTAKGKRAVFRNLLPGTYRLATTAPTTPEWQAPKEVSIELAPNKDSYRDVVFRKTP